MGIVLSAPTTVSVVVPTNNRPKLLRQALKSIRALEGRDLKIEICIGDNGENSENERIAAQFDCLYGRTSTQGAAAARNVALGLASGEFIGFLDDDDVYLADALRAQIHHMQANPNCRAVFGQVIFTDHNLEPTQDQWPTEAPADGDIFKLMLSGFFPQLGATVVRRCVLDEVGLLDEALIGDEDWDWQIRIARDYETAVIDAPCILFRGRAPGRHDELQALRVRFTRKVFSRHAFSAWRHWSSPIGFVKSFFLCQEHYFYYFLESAEFHKKHGEKRSARRALRQALWTFPTRFIRSCLLDRGFRQTHFSDQTS